MTKKSVTTKKKVTAPVRKKGNPYFNPQDNDDPGLFTLAFWLPPKRSKSC